MPEVKSNPCADWALVLGASSGFGAATARHLAAAGCNVCGVHLDRRATAALADGVVSDIGLKGREALFFNENAADDAKREEILDALAERAGTGGVRVLFHSLAFGSLASFIGAPGESLSRRQLEMTLDVMANSLVYWVCGLLRRGLMGRGGRVLAMTSEASSRVWRGYGAVSAAKAALESHVRQIALELGPRGITANAIRAGAADTPALRKVPGHSEILERARAKNPSGRITEPEDVAKAVCHLISGDFLWANGGVIALDGGEGIAG